MEEKREQHQKLQRLTECTKFFCTSKQILILTIPPQSPPPPLQQKKHTKNSCPAPIFSFIFFLMVQFLRQGLDPSGWPNSLGLRLPHRRSQVQNPLPAKARGMPSAGYLSYAVCKLLHRSRGKTLYAPKE